jgi:hypothetical protein
VLVGWGLVFKKRVAPVDSGYLRPHTMRARTGD